MQRQADLVRHGLLHEGRQGPKPERSRSRRATTLPLRSTAPTTISLPAPPVPPRSVAALVLVPVLSLAADERLVNLDDPHQLVEIFVRKSRADAVAHIPSRLVRTDVLSAKYLKRRHAFFADEHGVNDAKPSLERLVCVLKNRVYQNGRSDTRPARTRGTANETRRRTNDRKDRRCRSAGSAHPQASVARQGTLYTRCRSGTLPRTADTVSCLIVLSCLLRATARTPCVKGKFA